MSGSEYHLGRILHADDEVPGGLDGGNDSGVRGFAAVEEETTSVGEFSRTLTKNRTLVSLTRCDFSLPPNASAVRARRHWRLCS